MESARLSSLQTLLGHAEGERDGARAALGAAEDALARQRAQADQLAAYRQEYRQRWSAQFAQAGAPALLQHYHAFSQRLDQAIDQQARQCLGGEQRVRQARALLVEREQRVAAVRKLIERRLQALQRETDRRDQKRSDEAAQRAAWQNVWPARSSDSELSRH